MSSLWGFREVLCIVLRTIVSHFFFFLLAIVFSVLQFGNSDYPFGKFIRFHLVHSEVCIARSLVFFIAFCKSMSVLWSRFFLPLCCLCLFTNSDSSLGFSKPYLNFKMISTNEQVKFILRQYKKAIKTKRAEKHNLTIACLFQVMTWICNVTCRCLCNVQ